MAISQGKISVALLVGTAFMHTVALAKPVDPESGIYQIRSHNAGAYGYVVSFCVHGYVFVSLQTSTHSRERDIELSQIKTGDGQFLTCPLTAPERPEPTPRREPQNPFNRESGGGE